MAITFAFPPTAGYSVCSRTSFSWANVPLANEGVMVPYRSTHRSWRAARGGGYLFHFAWVRI